MIMHYAIYGRTWLFCKRNVLEMCIMPRIPLNLVNLYSCESLHKLVSFEAAITSSRNSVYWIPRLVNNDQENGRCFLQASY